MVLFSCLFVISVIDSRRLDYVIIGTSVSGFAILFFTNNLRLLLKAPCKIQIDSQHIFAEFYRNRIVKIPLTNVTKITKALGASSIIKICYVLIEKENSFLIHLDRLRVGTRFEVGDFVEEVLRCAPNLHEAEVEKFTDQMFLRQIAWGKAPDWTIINTAKRRAEENRNKLQQSQSKIQGTKESE